MLNNNQIMPGVIESIGGLQSTIKPLEETFIQHELRPYHVQRDYRQEYLQSQKGVMRSTSQDKPENMKVLSVSPYRAVVRYESSQRYTEDDDEQDESRNNDLKNRQTA